MVVSDSCALLMKAAWPLLMSISIVRSLPVQPDNLRPAYASTPRHVFILSPNKEKVERLEQEVVNAATPGDPTYGRMFSQRELHDFLGHPESMIDDILYAIKTKFGCSFEWMAPSGNLLTVENCNETVTEDTLRQVHPLVLDVQKILYYSLGRRRSFVPTLPTSSANVSRLDELVDPSQSQCINAAFSQLNNTSASPPIAMSLYEIPKQMGPCLANPRGQAVAMEIHNAQARLDLQSFFHTFAPHLEGQNLARVENNPQDCRREDIESILDAEWAMTIGQFVPTTFYAGALGHFPQWLMSVNSEPEPPLVHSISANWKMTDRQRQVWDIEVLKASARRITLIVSSGDQGSQCDIFTDRLGFTSPSSPYITVVGGTQLGCSEPGAGQHLQCGETAWPGSGGGFSEDYPMPPWQHQTVARYLAMNATSGKVPPRFLFKPSGRAMPDVALLSRNVPVIAFNELIPDGAGTSISAPLFAGIVSLLNNARLTAGKPPLGMLGPFLYSSYEEDPGAFHDIVEGSTLPTPGVGGYCVGYAAQKGWDPTSGLGSPRFPRLLTKAMRH